MSDGLLLAAADAQKEDLDELESLDQRIATLEAEKSTAAIAWEHAEKEWNAMSEAVSKAKDEHKKVKDDLDEKKRRYEHTLAERVRGLDAKKKANRLELNSKTAELESLKSGGGPKGRDRPIAKLKQDLRNLEARHADLHRKHEAVCCASAAITARRAFESALDSIWLAHEHVTHKPLTKPAKISGEDVQALLSVLINEIRDALLRGE
jgi:chromosome segregation ATPase